MMRASLVLALANFVAALSACGGAAASAPPVPQRDPMELIIEDGHAKVCQSKHRTLVCAVVQAPLPDGTTVNFWHTPNGATAISVGCLRNNAKVIDRRTAP